MAKPPSPNSRQPWTDEEEVTLRQLAEAGTPRSEIAHQLGRSSDAVANYASKIGVKLAHPGIMYLKQPEALPLPSAGDDHFEPARAAVHFASNEGTPKRFWPWALSADTIEPEVRLKVSRLDRPTLPWIWEIRHDGATHPLARSGQGYRSAQDAWDAGKVILAGTKRQGGLER